MKEFALLVDRLNSSTSTNDKVSALEHFFRTAPEKDILWTIALFTGRRPKRTISSTLLKNWVAELCGLPLWMVEECHHTVGDLSETIVLLTEPLFPSGLQEQEPQSLQYYLLRLMAIGNAGEEEKRNFMLQSWEELTATQRFVFNKLLSGSFRLGISRQLIIKALAKTTDSDPGIVAHKLSGNWHPEETDFSALLGDDLLSPDDSRPYPFYLAYPLEQKPEELGDPAGWQMEWKWDGIRGQIIKRNGSFFVWSRGEELMTDRFPEFEAFIHALPDGLVIDGEIVVASGGTPMPFALMQTRIGLKKISKAAMEKAPVSFFCFDLLEEEGKDIRNLPLAQRRLRLEQVLQQVNHPRLQLSPLILEDNWEDLARLRTQSRENAAEGFMIKRKSSIYQTGRKRGDWWKWKIDPLTIDAVMIYAQKGSGRRSNLYTDYTFAVRDGENFVPFAKAYSGLTDKEIARVDAFVKRNGIEKFGPVRTVKPELVFEIAFEGIAASKRHKSGVAVRFPRISRWRQDKAVQDINSIEDLRAMLDLYGQSTKPL